MARWLQLAVKRWVATAEKRVDLELYHRIELVGMS